MKETIVKFEISDIMKECYTADITNNYPQFEEEMKILKEAGFLGYQGQIEIEKVSIFSFKKLVAYYFLEHIKKAIYEKYPGWEIKDCVPNSVLEIVWDILKGEKDKSTFDENVIKAYVEICDPTELISLLKYVKKKYIVPSNGTIYEIPEWIQYALWERGALINKALFNILKENNLEGFLWYYVNPYIGAPYCSKEIFEQIEDSELRKVVVERELLTTKKCVRL